MVFDKTGTLTSGAPTVADVFLTPNSLSRTDFARTLLAVESRSEHPIGHAVVEYAESILKKGMGRRTQWAVNSNFVRSAHMPHFIRRGAQREGFRGMRGSQSPISTSLRAAGLGACWTARKVCQVYFIGQCAAGIGQSSQWRRRVLTRTAGPCKRGWYGLYRGKAVPVSIFCAPVPQSVPFIACQLIELPTFSPSQNWPSHGSVRMQC
jgi:hypothetical protein